MKEIIPEWVREAMETRKQKRNGEPWSWVGNNFSWEVKQGLSEEITPE